MHSNFAYSKFLQLGLSFQGKIGFLKLSDFLVLGIDSTSPLVVWFWEVMEEFGTTERSLFLRFVRGRTRLPRSIADFRGRDFVLQVPCLRVPSLRLLPRSPNIGLGISQLGATIGRWQYLSWIKVYLIVIV